MNFRVVITCLLITLSAISYNTTAQFSMALGGSGFYFVDSNDDNIHLSPQLRANFDWDNKVLSFQAASSFLMPVISKAHTYGYEVNPVSNIPGRIDIINSVEAYTVDAGVDFHYFFKGMPIDGVGFYGIGGAGMLYYNQTYSLSHFNVMDYYAQNYIDGANYASNQLTLDLGIGGKLPMRNKSWYYELKFTFLTDPYKDYGKGVQGSHFITFNTGINFHLKTRKGKYQRMSMGRTKKERKKSVKSIRR